MTTGEAAPREPTDDSLDRELGEFTIVGRGPARRLFALAGLVNREGRITPTSILALTAIVWLPTLVLAAVRGQALNWAGGLAFLEDLVTQVRVVVALPLYLVLDGYVDARLKRAVGEFVRRGIVQDLGRYARSLRRVQSLAGSGVSELVILAMAVGSVYLTHAGDLSATWWNGGGSSWTPAGLWYLCVVLPLIHFLLYRWIWRFMVWGGFLISLARMDLKLIATHPDGTGGLGFLGTAQSSFGIVTASAIAVLSARIGNRILHYGDSLRAYDMEVIVALAVMLVLVVCPLLVFTPLLLRAKRDGKYLYGRFGTEYVRDFHRKWIQGQGADPSPLGSADIQSLADLSNSYRVASDMNVLLFSRKTLTTVLVLNAAPLLPLGLTLMPFPELLMKVLTLLK